MSQAERIHYAPYLIGGKDSLIKLQILLYKDLYTSEVIQTLIANGKELCKEYLTISGRGVLRENSNLKEFKKQVIETNNEELISLLLDFYKLTPKEERDLLAVRRSTHANGSVDKLMNDYFSKNKVRTPAQKLLYRPEYAYYWQLFQQYNNLSCGDKMKYKFYQVWIGFRYCFGM